MHVKKNNEVYSFVQTNIISLLMRNYDESIWIIGLHKKYIVGLSVCVSEVLYDYISNMALLKTSNKARYLESYKLKI